MLKPAQLAPTTIPWLNSVSPLFPSSDMMWTLSEVLDYTPISHNTKHTGTDLTRRGIDSTRPLKVCCWYLAPLSPVSCEAQPLWIGLVYPVQPIDWDLGNLERIFAVWQEALSCFKEASAIRAYCCHERVHLVCNIICNTCQSNLCRLASFHSAFWCHLFHK